MDINTFDFFELIGLKNILQQDKDKLALDISEIVWEKFVIERIGKILSEKDLKAVNEMAQRSESAEKILLFVLKKAPDFRKSLTEFTAQVKIDMLNKQLESMLDDLEKTLLSTADETQKSLLKEKIETYRKAKDFLGKKEWDKLRDVMTKVH